MRLGETLGLLALACSLVVACAAQPQTRVSVEDAWARPAAPAGSTPAGAPTGQAMSTSAAYFTLIGSGTSDALLGVGVDPSIAGSAEMHETTVTNGVAAMSQVTRVEVPAGGRVEFEPGGYHVMLLDIRRELKPADRLSLTLEFEKAGSVSVDATVRSP